MNAEGLATPVGLIVGGSGSIGRAVVDRFRGAGWVVLATYRKSEPKAMSGVTWVRFDGLVESDIARLRRTVNELPGSLQAVVSLIGMPSSKRRITETPPIEWTAVFEGNVTANVRLWHAVSDRARRDSASIVFFSSDTTETLKSGNGAYTAAKAGLEAFAATLASEEIDSGIRVNILAPSLVVSSLAEDILKLKGVKDVNSYYETLPWGRALSPIEVAGVAFDITTAPHWKYMSGRTIRIAATKR